ncbi:MAG: hypothetical protein LBG87_05130 [Spirochaetaceae bacterium]|jgi:hypothetical protein|nr:hypothetical protein [Spirochaetaceae bacterium]
MQIVAILRPGKERTRVRFEDGAVEDVPNAYAETGKDYITASMLKQSDRYIRYEGEHITARLEKGSIITIRNKDNICSATIARSKWSWRTAAVWRLFLMETAKETAFASAVDYFERHGIAMLVSG